MTDTETTQVEETTEGLTTLSDVFDESPKPESEVTEVAAEPAKEDDKGETEAATETTAEAEPETVETVAEPPSAEDIGLQAALLAERDKRQTAERELEKLKAEPVTVPDPVEDPEGYADYLEGKNNASEIKSRIATSRAITLRYEPEFQSMESEFIGMVWDNEGNIINADLAEKFRSDPNPCGFLVDHIKEQREIAKLKDPKFAENLEATLRAKILKEIEEGATKGVSATEVPDLTKAASAGSNSQKVVEPATMDKVFEDSPL